MRVSVFGPNLRVPGPTFHVHAEGCADTRKSVYRGHRPATWDAASATEVCDEMYPPEDFDCKSGEYLDDFRFFPCCDALPN